MWNLIVGGSSYIYPPHTVGEVRGDEGAGLGQVVGDRQWGRQWGACGRADGVKSGEKEKAGTPQ